VNTSPSSLRDLLAARPGGEWTESLVWSGERVVEDDAPDPAPPNRATRRAAARAARRKGRRS
jgi:hypothetical protein